MTTPGYPDWERVQFAAGAIVISFRQAITVNTTLQAVNVSAWPFINIAFSTPSGSDTYQLQVNFFQDEGRTEEIATTSVTLNSDMQGFWCIPTETPWMSATIVPKAGGNNTQIVVVLYGSQEVSTNWQFDTFSTPLINASPALGVSGTASFFTFTLFSGMALLHADTAGAGTFEVDVAYFDFGANAYVTYLRHPGKSSTNALQESIPLLYAQTRITITNGSTAQTVNVSLTAQP